jgi:hypothetical protein
MKQGNSKSSFLLTRTERGLARTCPHRLAHSLGGVLGHLLAHVILGHDVEQRHDDAKEHEHCEDDGEVVEDLNELVVPESERLPVVLDGRHERAVRAKVAHEGLCFDATQIDGNQNKGDG